MKPANTNAPDDSGTLATMANDKSFLLRLSSEEIEAWKFAAKSDGRSLASWIRFQCNGALQETAHPHAIKVAKAKPRKVRR